MQLHCIIYGHVQGVFFRAATHKTATQMGLTGWVRNLPDGAVECMAQGSQEVLEDFLKWLHRGPPSAKVTHIQTEWQLESNPIKDFCII